MTKSKIVLLFISVAILVARIGWGRSVQLPAGTLVRLTIPTIDYPEYSESQTIIRRGKWEVRYKGYIDFIPGEVLSLVGIIDDRGRVISERVAVCKECIRPRLVDQLSIQISRLRHWAVDRIQQVLPEPHASLAIGILLGVKRNMPREFYDALVTTGTLHVVAASGYNVAVVVTVLLAVLGSVMPRYWAMGMSLLGIVTYVILAGGSASVVRAGVMGGLSMIGIMIGRQREVKWLLWVTIWLMLVVSPDLITDIGFQLSVSATVGLLYLTSWMQKFEIKNSKYEIIQKFCAEFVYPTVAATIATAPVIYWHFGRVSLIGVLVNLLILPLVPLIMLLAVLTIIVPPVGYLLFVPLWWVVELVRCFG